MSEESNSAAEPETLGECGKEKKRSNRFRFKSKSAGGSLHDCDHDSRGHKRRRHDDSSRRYRKRHRSSEHDPHNPTPSYLSPEQAFRESLFDALGDDEGASFWEGVYGQPIHSYPNTYEDEETGELERMTDEEYTQFVRRKMWEKSWEGTEAAKEEERRKRAKEKQRIREEERKTAEKSARYDDCNFESQIEASLRRGENRRDRKRWQTLWQDYLRRWDELQTLARNRPKCEDNAEQVFLRNKIAWPVETGRRKDVVREEIERFVRKGTENAEPTEGTDPFANVIKSERVRWHPDKIQQRYGFMEIDENTLKGVTAVFQVFDAIWNEIRHEVT
ncbi:uncharacterized protein Z518_07477 [Rhinocladiella mackenziei CBS 650.93]|uniref:Rhinocladiella mackenziei CBS 650.93 unplaced genomic scaffold supercont1.5, whole genome shotgun sequence n=1 Tax=Rhinocladiella mackenziei CBS 650.93 TaxID=1442369 RepID=A0A0D2IDN5_9EURO|nr:uncharacterized protein Z518_07477 [Rhinocladiella mackenziei CBS 650.93]KIX03924.1 hypothetical protein Z518_07477 [Rhinocladiella mackenziei CBS 650.93]